MRVMPWVRTWHQPLSGKGRCEKGLLFPEPSGFFSNREPPRRVYIHTGGSCADGAPTLLTTGQLLPRTSPCGITTARFGVIEKDFTLSPTLNKIKSPLPTSITSPFSTCLKFFSLYSSEKLQITLPLWRPTCCHLQITSLSK